MPFWLSHCVCICHLCEIFSIPFSFPIGMYVFISARSWWKCLKRGPRASVLSDSLVSCLTSFLSYYVFVADVPSKGVRDGILAWGLLVVSNLKQVRAWHFMTPFCGLSDFVSCLHHQTFFSLFPSRSRFCYYNCHSATSISLFYRTSAGNSYYESFVCKKA